MYILNIHAIEWQSPVSNKYKVTGCDKVLSLTDTKLQGVTKRQAEDGKLIPKCCYVLQMTKKNPKQYFPGKEKWTCWPWLKSSGY